MSRPDIHRVAAEAESTLRHIVTTPGVSPTRNDLARLADSLAAALHSSTDCVPVGAVEIADRLDVKRRTVDQWRQRATDFPEPRWTVGGRPAWNWDEVEIWAKRTGRVASE